MSNDQEKKLVGIWEQVGYIHPSVRSPQKWNPGAPNASVREFYVFFSDGRVMFAKFSADIKVEFNLVKQSFVNIDHAQKHMVGNFDLSGKTLTEKYEYEATQSTVKLGDLQEQHFSVLENTPKENFFLEVLYHKSVELPDNEAEWKDEIVELTNPWNHVLPRIQTHDCSLPDKYIHRSLCFMPRWKGTPWVSFYCQVGSWLVYKEPNIAESSLEIENQAIANLNQLPANWAPTESLDSLHIIHGTHAAERILDKKCMLEAQSTLETNMIAVAIPFADCLFVSKSFKNLLDFISEKFKNDFAITPWVFIISDGIVSGICSYGNKGEVIIDAVMAPEEYC